MMFFKQVIPHDVKQSLLVSVVFLAIVIFIVGRMIYRSNISRLLQYKKERQRVEIENDVARKLNELKKVREDIPPLKESSVFLGEIAKLAGQLNMKLVTISALPMEKRGNYIKYSVKLEVNNSYHEAGIFISRLETAKRFINIDDFKIATQGKVETNTATCSVEITLSTFYLTDTSLEI